MTLPVIETPRLILRPLRAGDAPQFLALAGDWEVARMTSDIPHPLTPGHARAWLRQSGGDVRFAVDLHGAMIGGAGYFVRRTGMVELGFWLGRDHWGFGFATEAAAAVVRHGFASGHQSFTSSHFVDNPASGHVLGKLGFEVAGRGRMWSAARGHEVEAIGLLLTRERAEDVLGPIPVIAPPRTAWRNRVGRWLGTA
jgi:RimJ/RimL family protein N-acetyltransferase